ncbi:hypothetical protein MTR67_033674, partial [Solanum verrucosum]
YLLGIQKASTNMGMLIIPMAISPPITTNIFSSFCLRKPSLVISKANLSTIPQNHTRRSGNYKPPMWDFQYIQSIHNDYVEEEYMKRFNELMKEMKKNLMVMVEGSRWWKSSSLAENLPFARDRIVEAFFWIVGTMFEPQYSNSRRMLAKVAALGTLIDDIYDVYGTLDELELFTDVVERMDVKAMDQLPNYMKVCYLALFNSITEIAYEVLKEQGINIIPYLTKSWADLCKALLREAKWYYNGYTPSLEEYMDNAWMSIGIPVIVINVFFCVTNPITKEAIESLSKYPHIIRCSATIIRLADDLATSMVCF